MWIWEEAEEQHSCCWSDDGGPQPREHYSAEDLLPSEEGLLVISWRRNKVIQTKEVQLQKIQRTAGNKEYNGHQQMTLGGRSFEILEYILTGDVHKKLSMLMYAGGQKRSGTIKTKRDKRRNGTRKPSGIRQEIQALETEIELVE